MRCIAIAEGLALDSAGASGPTSETQAIALWGPDDALVECLVYGLTATSVELHLRETGADAPRRASECERFLSRDPATIHAPKRLSPPHGGGPRHHSSRA